MAEPGGVYAWLVVLGVVLEEEVDIEEKNKEGAEG